MSSSSISSIYDESTSSDEGSVLTNLSHSDNSDFYSDIPIIQSIQQTSDTNSSSTNTAFQNETQNLQIQQRREYIDNVAYQLATFNPTTVHDRLNQLRIIHLNNFSNTDNRQIVVQHNQWNSSPYEDPDYTSIGSNTTLHGVTQVSSDQVTPLAPESLNEEYSHIPRLNTDATNRVLRAETRMLEENIFFNRLRLHIQRETYLGQPINQSLRPVQLQNYSNSIYQTFEPRYTETSSDDDSLPPLLTRDGQIILPDNTVSTASSTIIPDNMNAAENRSNIQYQQASIFISPPDEIIIPEQEEDIYHDPRQSNPHEERLEWLSRTFREQQVSTASDTNSNMGNSDDTNPSYDDGRENVD